MVRNDSVTLADIVIAWLEKLRGEADKMNDTARKMLRIEDSDHTRSQAEYAKRLVSAVKWIQSRVPRNWHSKLTADMVTTANIVAAASPKARPRRGDVPTLADCDIDVPDDDAIKAGDSIGGRVAELTREIAEMWQDTGGEG